MKMQGDDLTPVQVANASAIVREVARRPAASLALSKRAAVICIETSWIEAHFYSYANPNVPESLKIPHDGLGSDHASVGPFQQQVPGWGTAADCMNVVHSTAKFLDGAGDNPGLLNLPHYRFEFVGHPEATRWDQLPTGDAAQAVQVSAFPDRYIQAEADAIALVNALWPQEADMFRVKIYGTAGQPAAASAPGLWQPVTTSMLRVLTLNGECDGKIHMVSAEWFAQLRKTMVGK